MNKRQQKKQTQKLCMYFCMNAYLVSFINVNFNAFNLPPLISKDIKKNLSFSILSQKNIKKQFLKGLRIFYRLKKSQRIIWENKLPLLKSHGLTNALLDIVEKMFRLRLTTLRNCVKELFSDEDFDCLQSFLHGDLKLSKQETTAEIDRIKMSLLS